ncbi:MAG: BatD family protein [Acidobacteria bacterium]|nr:BatD family protein [Acidobacteriota bacterium]MBV9068456.1 BatD family protein [Acidobacteriota bacterium]MBV9187390.1 BatD family protein [Acidobacteriota bacterium]
MLLALPAMGSDLQVDKRTLSTDDALTITLTLTDAFASADNLQLPMQNLVIDGSPSVSSEFSWINGQSSRRKVLRYVARPIHPGAALVGPLTLHGADGQVETLAPLSIQVLPDLAAGTNDPIRILHELMATGRDPIFVVAEADKSNVFVGEQVIVTWTIYNAANVQQHGISRMPKLADFWVEELDIRGQTPQQVFIGGVAMQKLVIRRVALFPLRAGTLNADPLAIEAQIMKPLGSNLLRLFEGSVVDVQRRSSPLAIETRPIPPGPPVTAVGDVALQCEAPVQKNGGPVAVEVIMTGAANLRAAPPPSFAQAIDGSVQIAEGAVSVQRRDEAVMTRRWRFLIFPNSTGMFVVPPLTAQILTPAGVRREIRCEQRTLLVQAADAASTQPHGPPMPGSAPVEAARQSLPFIGIAAAILILLAIAWPRIARARAIRRDVRALVRETPAETRIAVDEWLSGRGVDSISILRETSDRGDAYRALRSLLDAAERDRLIAEPVDVRGRVRDLLATF